MTIITELSGWDADEPVPGPVVKLPPGFTTEDLEKAGTAAGDQCGRDFAEAYGPGSAANVNHFWPSLSDAMATMVIEMSDQGATVDQITAWREAFDAAFTPHMEQAAKAHRIDEIIGRAVASLKPFTRH